MTSIHALFGLHGFGCSSRLSRLLGLVELREVEKRDVDRGWRHGSLTAAHAFNHTWCFIVQVFINHSAPFDGR